MKKNIDYRNYLKTSFSGKKKLINIYDKILEEINTNLDKTKDTFHVLSDKLEFNYNDTSLKKFRKFNTIVLIGMGGSILGSKAIFNFLKHQIKKKIIFFDNIDAEKLFCFKKENKLSECLFIIISKSGNTIETLANLHSLNILKKNAKNIIIISEKSNNVLYTVSKKYNLFFVEHKKYLGGRYSVLSEVGLVPAYVMGLDKKKIRKNLLNYLKTYKKRYLKESSIILGNILNRKVFKNIIFLNYCPELESFLYWAQQLIAESHGKKGKGLLPVISNSPKDHHSVLQLYLDGPQDKIFYLFGINKKIKKNFYANSLDKRIIFLKNKNLYDVKSAQQKAVKKVLIKKKIPFREFNINFVNEETIGELFSYFILETSIVGKIANINPFDQPAVEQVKINTTKILR